MAQDAPRGRELKLPRVTFSVATAGKPVELHVAPDYLLEQVEPERHFMFNVGGGVSFPLSDSGDCFETGGGFQLGAGFQFKRRFGVTAEYLYMSHGVQGDVLAESGL